MTIPERSVSIRYKLMAVTPTLLVLAFVVLRMCKVVAWSWWWVLAVLWVPSAVFVAATEIVAFL